MSSFAPSKTLQKELGHSATEGAKTIRCIWLGLDSTGMHECFEPTFGLDRVSTRIPVMRFLIRRNIRKICKYIMIIQDLCDEPPFDDSDDEHCDLRNEIYSDVCDELTNIEHRQGGKYVDDLLFQKGDHLDVMTITSEFYWTPEMAFERDDLALWLNRATHKELLQARGEYVVEDVFLTMQRAKRDHQSTLLRRLPDELLDMVIDEVAQRFYLKVVCG